MTNWERRNANSIGRWFNGLYRIAGRRYSNGQPFWSVWTAPPEHDGKLLENGTARNWSDAVRQAEAYTKPIPAFMLR